MQRREGNNTEHKSIHNPSIMIEKEEPKKEADGLEILTNILAGEDEKKKKRKLERRRSSIDEHMDLKFGADVNSKAKEVEERKKRLLENIQGEKKEEDDDPIIGQNLLDLKFGKVSSKKEENSSTEKSGSNKDEGSHEKISSGLGLIGGLIDNILPPIS